MGVYDALLLMAALPTLAGRGWCSVAMVAVVARSSPEFTPQSVAVVAAVHQHATLHCEIQHLADKSVSWVRSRDLQILTHSGVVFTMDGRVSTTVDGNRTTSRHSLHIDRLRTSDAGRYECQLNTDPKMSLFFNLTVLDEPVPETVVTLQGPPVVRAALGGTVTLECEARYEPPPRELPLPPLDIHWLKDDEIIDLQSPRGGEGGGVWLDTERWAARAVSRLTLAALGAPAAGRYTCRAGGRAAGLTLLLAEGDLEAMQRDQAAAVRASPAPPPRRAHLALALVLVPAAVPALRILNT
ncbi:hemicentin-2-like [Achroia grisella]|uniref:hemicentin-2-like n=1 Tax=Achroia grisella TaxID=688607 RepID=UPI0027D26363|nr:hemicentin-2-like [Achroia grisella]